MKNRTFSSEAELKEISQALKDIELDGLSNTTSTYSANANLYADNRLPFVEKHLAYIKTHPQLDPYQYIANLKLRVKIKNIRK